MPVSKPIKIECLLILNDDNEHAYQAVQTNLVPFLVKSRELGEKLDLKVEYENKDFLRDYPNFKQRVLATKCRNVFFNLDQCGYGQVSDAMIRDIISSWRSSEIILTFSIQSLLTFLSPTKANQIGSMDPALSEKISALYAGSGGSMSKREWLGAAEKVSSTISKIVPRLLVHLRSTIQTAGSIGSCISPLHIEHDRYTTTFCTIRS